MESERNFWQARKDFLAHLRYTKGYSEGTCYGYNSDLGIWGRWLEREEQQRLKEAAHNIDDLPENIFGRTREHILAVRRRYDFLFGLIQNSGLRITEALWLKVWDVRQVDGLARSVRVIGKGDKERSVPLPEAFGGVFGTWLAGRPREEFVFAKKPGGKPPGARVVRAYLKRLVEKARIDKPVTPHKLRHYLPCLTMSSNVVIPQPLLLNSKAYAQRRIRFWRDRRRL